MKLLLTLPMSLLLISCMTPQFSREGYADSPQDHQDFAKASTKCQVMTRQAGGDQNFYNQCMYGDGWYLTGYK